MITTNLTGNLGNHMWQYAVCRMVAETLGYQWGINPSPSHDYFGGQSQMDFMDVDFGLPVAGITNEFHERWTTYRHVDEVNITRLDPRVYEIPDNTIMIGHNGAKGGIYQSEDYLIDRKSEVLRWFQIKSGYKLEYEKILADHGVLMNDELCVINFRGGEYRSIPNVLVRREYWRDAISYMLHLNPAMRFLLITDDVQCANSFMPFPIQAIHVNVGFDFYVVNQASHVILSNSTFGWWAAWLNTKARNILAPKYWARHNVSDGYWSVGDSYTRDFQYLDRNGHLWEYNECKAEAEAYYAARNL